MSTSSAPTRRNGAIDHDRRYRRACGRLRPDRLEGDQRPIRRVARRLASGSRRSSGSTAISARDASTRPAPMLELIFHELDSEWALEIVRGVERVAGQHHLAVVLSEMQGRRTPGRGWIEGVLARRPDRRHRGLLRPERDRARPAADPRHPVRRRRSDRRAAPRHALDRRDQLERRAGRDAAPARPRAPADRGDRRARARSCAAGHGSTATARRWTPPACRSTPS